MPEIVINVERERFVGCPVSTRWTTQRIISGVVALCFLGFAGKFFVDTRQLRKQFEGWGSAKPVDTVVDLSTPGEVLTTFRQTCSSAHSEVVALRVPAALLQETATEQLLDGAKGRIEVYGKLDTNIVASAELEMSTDANLVDGAIPVFSLPSFPKGEYEARVIVTSGARALKGVPQRLEGRYLLCGMEALPAVVAKFLGIACSVIGGLVAIVLLYRLMRVPPHSRGFVSGLDSKQELGEDLLRDNDRTEPSSGPYIILQK
jgi:hypothetical protein